MNERLLRLPEVKHRTGLCRSAIYDLIKKDAFPGPVPIGPRARAWPESAVDAWIERRIAEGRRSVPKPRLETRIGSVHKARPREPEVGDPNLPDGSG